VKIDGTRSFGAPRVVLWDVLNDPQRMAGVMPGVERFDVHDDDRWTANVVVPLGLGGLRMKIDFETTERREPEYARLHAKGQGVGALMNMDTEFHLAEEGEGTAMRWEADVRIAGPVGSMGQRVLQPIVNQQVKNVLNALDEQVRQAPGGSAGGSAEASSELLDAGPPPEGVPGKPEGTSGGEEGVSPLAPEAYEDDPQGPTHSA